MENGLAGIWGEEIAGAGEYLRAGEIPGRSTGDPGRVPLSLQKNAKDGEQGTQLADAQTSVPCLPTHFPASQEEAFRDPGAPVPGDSSALGID